MSTISDRSEDVVWRQLQNRVWVARREGRHIGLVEEGRRFTFVEPCGVAHPGYASLVEAQQAVDQPTWALPPDRPHVLESAAVVLLLGAVIVAAGTLAVLLSIALGLLR